jgi:endonuclease YncB( thermonuclease family)
MQARVVRIKRLSRANRLFMSSLSSMVGALFACSVLTTTVSAAVPPPILGVASVIDGDTIEIRGVRIRLHGIDAPESRQLCTRTTGEQWRCGQRASLALADMIGRSTVSCDPRDTDRYGRTVAVCRVRGLDLNGWMVIQGWAVAYRRYSKDYMRAEDQARAAKRGIWAGQFQMPAEWRSAQRSR